MREISDEQRRAWLGARHMLANQADTVTHAADRLSGLHATDPASVYLSARARVSRFVKADLEKALYSDKALVRILGMRRTLFAVPTELAGPIMASCTSRYLASERKRLTKALEEQHDRSEAWLNKVEKNTLAALKNLGKATANELTVEVPELATKLTFGEGKQWGGQVGISTRVLFLLAAEGLIVRGQPVGTWLSSQYRWVATERWLGTSFQAPDPIAAQQELAQRWLRTYGPGTANDLKWWSGWGLRETRQAIEAIGAVPVLLSDGTGYVHPDADDPPETGGWAAFLPALDPTAMGWKDRDWYLGGHRRHLYDRNGNIGPTIWLDGRIVGGWTVAGDEVRFRLLEEVASAERALIDDQAAELKRWLGDDTVLPRFRTPLEKDLSS